MLFNKRDVKIIVAVDKNGGFGYKGEIPWHHKEDFAFFRKHTTGQPCVMGRHTYNEIHNMAVKRGGGFPSVLPNRTCYVVSNTIAELPNAQVVRSVSEVTDHSFFVIGGKLLYNDALDYANQIYLTQIDKEFQCDTFFNMRYVKDQFQQIDSFPAETPELSFTLWERK